MFSGRLEEFFHLQSRLRAHIQTVYNLELELATCKIREQYNHAPTINESMLVALLKCNKQRSNISAHSTSISESTLKKLRLLELSDEYTDTQFTVSTSSMGDRLSSIIGNTMGDRRRNLLSANVEQQLFLHANAHCWGVSDVQFILNHENEAQ